MKLYNKIMCGVAATLTLTAMQSCSDEKATLDGANTVYIELQPKEISMAVGDTVYLSATVSNESGDIIETPITWSVDNSDVARLEEIVEKRAAKKGSRAEGEGEGEPTEPGDKDPEAPATPEPVDSIEIRRWAVIGQVGAQDKTTNVRATLENGQYAVAPVSIMSRDLSKAVSPITTFIRSYARQMNDTVWFSVTPFQLVDEAEIKFEMEVTERITEDLSGSATAGEFANPRLYIDRDNKRVGVVYTGPRLTGKGECRMWLTQGGLDSEVATVPIHIYPLIWPGFEVNGHRPNYGPPTPSNIKVTLMNETMDVNQTFNVGVCLGVDAGSDLDIQNVMEAEKAGFMRWTIEGSGVVVEDSYWNTDYESGYVSYLRVRSGQRTGLSVIKYFMPDTVLTCNLSVDDYNKTYPVDRIKVVQNQEEVDHVNFQLGLPATIEVSVEPEASFDFHKPEIAVADPSILEVQPVGENAGYTRTFTLHRAGNTTITITSLDKTVTIPVTVEDRIDNIAWDNANPKEMFVGTEAIIKATPRWASGKPVDGDVTWTVSDESIATVTPTGRNGEATVKALKEGSVDIVAEYEGTKSNVYTLVIKAADDVRAADYAERGETLSMGDGGDGTFYIVFGDNTDLFATIPFVEEGVFAGTFTGDNAYVELNSVGFENCSYNITVVDNGDGTCTITGTITMPNGARAIMNGETFTVE